MGAVLGKRPEVAEATSSDDVHDSGDIVAAPARVVLAHGGACDARSATDIDDVGSYLSSGVSPAARSCEGVARSTSDNEDDGIRSSSGDMAASPAGGASGACDAISFDTDDVRASGDDDTGAPPVYLVSALPLTRSGIDVDPEERRDTIPRRGSRVQGSGGGAYANSMVSGVPPVFVVSAQPHVRSSMDVVDADPRERRDTIPPRDSSVEGSGGGTYASSMILADTSTGSVSCDASADHKLLDWTPLAVDGGCNGHVVGLATPILAVQRGDAGEGRGRDADASSTSLCAAVPGSSSSALPHPCSSRLDLSVTALTDTNPETWLFKAVLEAGTILGNVEKLRVALLSAGGFVTHKAKDDLVARHDNHRGTVFAALTEDEKVSANCILCDENTAAKFDLEITEKRKQFNNRKEEGIWPDAWEDMFGLPPYALTHCNPMDNMNWILADTYTSINALLTRAELHVRGETGQASAEVNDLIAAARTLRTACRRVRRVIVDLGGCPLMEPASIWRARFCSIRF